MGSARETERKVNAIVEEILDEDEEGLCPGGCDRPDSNTEASPSQEVDRDCKCAVENSWRFSLRVMEAMRALQRDPDQSYTSTAEDIVDYIRYNYRSDGDLYAQVRTALRQVCSQGFVVEIIENEYYLIGPVANSTRPSGCSFDCEAQAFSMTTDDIIARRRRSVNDRETDAACRCGHFPRRNGPQRSPRSPRERALRETISTIDHFEDLSTEEILHSTRKPVNDDRNNDYRAERLAKDSPFACDCEDERRRRRDDTSRIQEAEQASPIAGPSRMLPRTTSPIPAKKARPMDQEETYSRREDEENDEETTTEEEESPDCTCDTVKVAQKPKKRPRNRTPRVVVENQRDKRPRKKVQEDAGDEVVAGEEDEDADDNVYRRLRGRRGRSATRERELKRWIRRCREECERRRAR